MAPFPTGTVRSGTPTDRRRHPSGPRPGTAATPTPTPTPTSASAIAAADGSAGGAAADGAPDAIVACSGAPPVAHRHRGRRPRRWTLVTAFVAASVLVVALAIDRGHPAAPAAARAQGSALSAASTVATDVNALAVDLAGEEDALRGCPLLTSAAGLACTEAADQRMGTELASFVRAVARVHVPAGDVTTAARLRRDATTLADDLRALGGAPTAARYLAVSGGRHVQPLGRAIDRDAKDLLGALRR